MNEQPGAVDLIDDPDEHRSLLVAASVTLLAALSVFGFSLISHPAAWVAGIGAGLLAIGVFGGVRGLVSCGVGLVAIAALVATNGDSLPFTLSVSAATAVLCIALLLMADMSFSMRRASVVSPVTVQGLASVHAIAAAIGITLAALLVSAVLAVSWPGWLLLLPAVVLGAASFLMARQASRYNRKLHPAPQRPAAGRMPPPPPVGIRSTMPPAPAPGTRTPRLQPPPPPPQTFRAKSQPPPPPG